MAGIKLYGGESEIFEINMTPFVDIILVVLVIFMATATFVAQGKIPLKLPHASAQPVKNDTQKPIEISLTKDGAIFFDGEPVEIKALAEKLSGSVRTKNGVILRSDAKAEFENAVSVIDVCKKCGIEKFAIQTQSGNRQ